MTPQTFLEELARFTKQDDPDGLLAFAERHLGELMCELSPAEMQRVNSMGEWAITSVSLRDAHEHAQEPTTAA